MKKVNLPSNFFNYNFSTLAKKEKNAALKIRYLAFSHIAAGKTVLETSFLVLKSNRIIHKWLNKLAIYGIDGLKDKNGRGRKLFIPKEKELEFKNIVIEFQKEKAKGKLTGFDIKFLLNKNYNIECSLPTAYSVLSRLGVNDIKKQK
ncbi:MAG TPA: hypothetical protein PKD00_04150 [Burkholderiales bacterium]|nr:hypothetical protein [Burkholderiales bacterium]